MMSSEFEWHTENGEGFSFLGHNWDVRTAKRIIQAKPRQVHLFDPIRAGALSPFIRLEDGALPIDLAVPCILSPFKGANMPIDGWHRIREALKTGVKELPAVMLTAAEDRLVRGAQRRGRR